MPHPATELPVPVFTEVTSVVSWPPFRLAEGEQPAAALLPCCPSPRMRG
ncbi:hypothetical protein [Streptomyces shenzhenensis]|nr:hypothetical protein [Streptomyces shenzhenensis]